MAGTVYTKGLDSIIISLKNLHPGQDPHLRSVCDQTAGIIEGAVQQNASLTDHDLQELSHYHYLKDNGVTKSGYIGAYSKRMGADSGPHPDEQVHIHSRSLYNAIKSNVVIGDSKATITVGVTESDFPQIKSLIYGTSKMRPRDFLGHAWHDIKPKAMEKLKSGIVAGLKSRIKTGR
jgi:hypothetical protein